MPPRLARRRFLQAVGAGAASLMLPRGVCPAGERGGKPNLIVILADDLGYGDVGCYGGKAVATPKIDALAGGGMRFTDFHSNAPVCSPTRAALLTGRYQQRCGVEGVLTVRGHRHTGMDLAETTFAEVLKAAGYATALFGKWHLGYPVRFNPTKQGFDEFRGYVSGNVDYHSHVDQGGVEDWWKDCRKVPEKGYTTDLITGHGVRFIERHRDKPFCLYLAHESPHYPYQGRKDKPERIAGRAGSPVGSRADRAGAYREMIQALDEGVGQVAATVRRLGLERRTLIVFCSDNGPAGPGAAGPLRGRKGSLWEGGHRVPGIACWPGRIRAGSVTDAAAMTMDLFPTMASAAGATLPKGLDLDGADLLPVLTGRGKLADRKLFWRFRNQKAVRDGAWKLLLAAGAPPRRKRPGRSAPPTALYHLADDLAERNNLAEREPKRAAALRAALAAWEADVTAGVQRQS
jgi:arylsulfatase A